MNAGEAFASAGIVWVLAGKLGWTRLADIVHRVDTFKSCSRYILEFIDHQKGESRRLNVFAVFTVHDNH